MCQIGIEKAHLNDFMLDNYEYCRCCKSLKTDFGGGKALLVRLLWAGFKSG
jgi:hypothetical protein